MLTIKRLDQAYKDAEEIPFDDKSKFIFFSDVHRGDNSMSDEFAHNQSIYFHALDHYYENGFTYVEVGDGDELWEHAKFNYIRGAHSDVYELLKEFYKDNRLIMIYGNHNVFLKNQSFVEKNLYYYYDEYNDREVELFPGIKIYESIKLKKKDTGHEIFVVHGHQGDFMNDQLWRVSMAGLRYFWRYMHIVGFRNPASPAKNVLKQHKIEKNFKKWHKLDDVMMICGHTHRPKFPAKGDRPYFNTGCCVHPRGITGIEVCEGKITLINWRISPDKDGSLHIVRRIVRGPELIENFNKKDF